MSNMLYYFVQLRFCTLFKILSEMTLHVALPKCLYDVQGSTDIEKIASALAEAATLYRKEYAERGFATKMSLFLIVSGSSGGKGSGGVFV